MVPLIIALILLLLASKSYSPIIPKDQFMLLMNNSNIMSSQKCSSDLFDLIKETGS